MHTPQQRGLTTRDPRIACRTLTIAAATMLCLFTTFTSTQAANLTLVIDHDQSYIAAEVHAILGPEGQIADFQATAQSPGADIANYTGTIKIDVQPGTIQLMTGSSMVPDTTGNYKPGDDGTSTPIVNGTSPGNYGFAVAALGAFSILRELDTDFGAPDSYSGTAPLSTTIPAGGIPTTPMNLIGAGPSYTFDLAGQAMSFTAGRRGVVSSIAPDQNAIGGFSGYPTLFGTNGADTGSWDGTTLILPVHSVFTELLTDTPAYYYQRTFLTGQLVAHVVPEPSSLVLLSMAAVGLAGCVWRARRRIA